MIEDESQVVAEGLSERVCIAKEL